MDQMRILNFEQGQVSRRCYPHDIQWQQKPQDLSMSNLRLLDMLLIDELFQPPEKPATS